MKELIKYGLGILLLCILIQVVSYISVLPGLPLIGEGVITLWKYGTLWHNIEVSSARWLIGWSIGSLLGIVAGYLTGRIQRFRLLLEGFFVVLRAIPFVCLVPIAVLLFGLEERGKFFIVAWASASITWIMAHNAALNVAPHHRWRALSLGAGRRKWIFRVLVPATAEGIYGALRTSLGLALIVVAIAELSGVYESSSGYWWSEGLGYRMFKSLDQSRNDLLMAGILCFAFLGIIGDILFRAVWYGVAWLDVWYKCRRARERVALVKRKYKDRFTIDYPQPAAVSLDKLVAKYGRKTVINGLSLTITPGHTLSIVGPSGSGKTTLIRAIGHFTDSVFHVSDSVQIDGALFVKAGPRVGIVMQEAPVFSHLTVWDNILFGANVPSPGDETGEAMAYYLLKEFGLEAQAASLAGALSGGQRQRVAFAMALANRPGLLLLDEPFGSLDAITRRHLQRFYEQNIHGRVTAIFVTHDVEEALLVGDMIRVGVQEQAAAMHIDKDDSDPHVWELSRSFNAQKALLITQLEAAV